MSEVFNFQHRSDYLKFHNVLSAFVLLLALRPVVASPPLHLRIIIVLYLSYQLFFLISQGIQLNNLSKCRSQWPCGLRRRSSAARPLKSWVRIPPEEWMFVCCECCVLLGRGLCDGLITRPEESYRLWRVVVCDQETLKTRRLKPATGLWKIQPQWAVTPGKQTNQPTNKKQTCQNA